MLVLGRRRPRAEDVSGESEVCTFVVSSAAFLPSKRGCAVRRGLGADGVEQHAAHGGEAPAETLRQERAAGRPHEGAVPGRESSLYVFYSLSLK